MVSTPNAPDGLFERIEKEPEETCHSHLKTINDDSQASGKLLGALIVLRYAGIDKNLLIEMNDLSSRAFPYNPASS
jgi:hypothetical protein